MADQHAMVEVLDREAVDPARGLPRQFHVQFNPTQYDIAKTVNYSETATKQLDLPTLSFMSGQMETLSLELFFDTTEHGMGSTAKDVRELTCSFYQLTQVQPKTHAPPRIQFTWGKLSFRAVVSDLKQSFTLFNPEGIPLRAKLSVTFKKYMTIKEQEAAINKQSPDHFKLHEVQRGETLSGIAAQEYGNPRHWRLIAEANAEALPNPRRPDPGTMLYLPRLDLSAASA